MGLNEQISMEIESFDDEDTKDISPEQIEMNFRFGRISDTLVSESAYNALLSLRDTCPCDFCKLPMEMQHALVRAISHFSTMAKLRIMSPCWKMRFFAFGPGRGILEWGSTTTSSPQPFPREPPSPYQSPLSLSTLPLARLALGPQHVLALTTRGHTYAQGINTYGQLGSPPTGDSTPEGKDMVRVGGALGVDSLCVTRIACGLGHSMALTAKAEVYTWGHNEYGQLGDGTRESHWDPKRVLGALASRKVVRIGAGHDHCIALTEQGEVFTWGRNHKGQLGDRTLNDRTTPVHVRSCGGLGPLRRVKCGPECSSVLTEIGQIIAWGGFFSQGALLPLNILDSVKHYSFGQAHVLAVTHSGTLFFYQLSTTEAKTILSQEFNRAPYCPARRVASGDYHMITLTRQGDILTWGQNDRGQLGDGTLYPKETPTFMTFPYARGTAREMKLKAAGGRSLLWAKEVRE